jgi:hypothetical protein
MRGAHHLVRIAPALGGAVTETKDEHGHTLYTHRWASPDGKHVVSITTDHPDGHIFTDEDERRMQADVRRAVDQAASARKLYDTPEFRRQMADLAAHQRELMAVNREKIQKQLDVVMATIRDAHIEETAARAEAQANAIAMRENLKAAAKAQREVEKALRDAAPAAD